VFGIHISGFGSLLRHLRCLTIASPIRARASNQLVTSAIAPTKQNLLISISANFDEENIKTAQSDDSGRMVILIRNH